MLSRKKTLVIGSAVCDIVIPVDHLPSRNEDINVYHQDLSLGGCAFNVCDCLHHFGVPFTAFLPTGGGIYGQFVKNALKERGIESFCPETEAENGCCYCLVEPDGERTFVCYHGAEYLFEEEWFRLFERSQEAEDTDSVYVCGLEIEEKTGERILAFLERHREYRIFYAPGVRICEIQKDRMNRVLDLSPVLHLNEDEALRYTRSPGVEEAGRKLCARTKNTVLVTCGSRGCMIFEADDGSCTRVEPYPAAERGDTIGAGDSHIGSVIALLRKGCSMEEAVRGANCVASVVVSTMGSLLTEEQFEEAMARWRK